MTPNRKLKNYSPNLKDMECICTLALQRHLVLFWTCDDEAVNKTLVLKKTKENFL